MFPLLRKKGTFRLYPKKLNYLFLAVFAFFSPFCYAKTAFSCSPDILSQCTPDVTMVKNVVKSVSEKMICGHHFAVRKCSENSSAGSEEKHREQRRNTPTTACGLPNRKQRKLCGQVQIKLHGQIMWSGIDQITWSNYVVGAENNTPFLPPQVLYCNSSSSGCQGPLKIKINAQNLIRSKQRKSPSRPSPSSRC